jgi:hypothetical protein
MMVKMKHKRRSVLSGLRQILFAFFMVPVFGILSSKKPALVRTYGV